MRMRNKLKVIKELDVTRNLIASMIGGILTVLFNSTIIFPNLFMLFIGFVTGFTIVFFATIFTDLIYSTKMIDYLNKYQVK